MLLKYKYLVYFTFSLLTTVGLYIVVTSLHFRYGRVNFVLAQRLELLQEVARLQDSLNVPGDVSYTCETAGYFYLSQVCIALCDCLFQVIK